MYEVGFSQCCGASYTNNVQYKLYQDYLAQSLLDQMWIKKVNFRVEIKVTVFDISNIWPNVSSNNIGKTEANVYQGENTHHIKEGAVVVENQLFKIWNIIAGIPLGFGFWPIFKSFNDLPCIN